MGGRLARRLVSNAHNRREKRVYSCEFGLIWHKVGMSLCYSPSTPSHVQRRNQSWTSLCTPRVCNYEQSEVTRPFYNSKYVLISTGPLRAEEGVEVCLESCWPRTTTLSAKCYGQPWNAMALA